jgi:hypothetical protein
MKNTLFYLIFAAIPLIPNLSLGMKRKFEYSKNTELLMQEMQYQGSSKKARTKEPAPEKEQHCCLNRQCDECVDKMLRAILAGCKLKDTIRHDQLKQAEEKQ